MLRTGESETEILLGNKQLLGVFFVIAILLGAAFTGGYAVGRSSSGKKSLATGSEETAAASAGTKTPSAIETHSVPPEGAASDSLSAPQEASKSPSRQKPGRLSEPSAEAAPLGSRRASSPKSQAQDASVESDSSASSSSEPFSPQSGQQFLQVVAVGRDEAEAVADVLHKKGFRAHAVPKPGSPKIYRVLIGPIRDAGDLSSTRESLRRTGFREVIVQRY